MEIKVSMNAPCDTDAVKSAIGSTSYTKYAGASFYQPVGDMTFSSANMNQDEKLALINEFDGEVLIDKNLERLTRANCPLRKKSPGKNVFGEPLPPQWWNGFEVEFSRRDKALLQEMFKDEDKKEAFVHELIKALGNDALVPGPKQAVVSTDFHFDTPEPHISGYISRIPISTENGEISRFDNQHTWNKGYVTTIKERVALFMQKFFADEMPNEELIVYSHATKTDKDGNKVAAWGDLSSDKDVTRIANEAIENAGGETETVRRPAPAPAAAAQASDDKTAETEKTETISKPSFPDPTNIQPAFADDEVADMDDYLSNTEIPAFDAITRNAERQIKELAAIVSLSQKAKKIDRERIYFAKETTKYTTLAKEREELLKQSNQTIEQQTQTISENTSKIEQQADQINKITNELQSQTDVNNRLVNECTELTSQNEEQKRSIDALTQELMSSKNTIQEYEDKIEHLIERKDKLLDANEEIKIKYTELSSNYSKLKDAFNKQKEDNEQLYSANNDLTEQNAQLEQQKKHFEQMYKSQQTYNDDLQKDFNTQRERYLTAIETRDEDLSKKDVEIKQLRTIIQSLQQVNKTIEETSESSISNEDKLAKFKEDDLKKKIDAYKNSQPKNDPDPA